MVYPHGRRRLGTQKTSWAYLDHDAMLSRAVPRYIRVRRRLSFYAPYLAIVLLFATAFGIKSGLPERPLEFALIAYIAAGLIDLILLARFEHRLARRLREHDRLLCTHCAYPLHGREQHGRCPECGTEYDHDSLRVAWANLRWTFWKPRG